MGLSGRAWSNNIPSVNARKASAPTARGTSPQPHRGIYTLTAQPHHAALPHILVGAGLSDHPFGEAVEERSSILVLLLGPAVGGVPRRHDGVLEVQVAAVSTDLSNSL